MPFDMNLFKEPTAECNRNSDDIPITERCSRLKRLCTATKYSNTLRTNPTLKDDEKRSLFMEFNEDVYHSLIDDFTHLIQEHDRNIDRIHTEWTELYQVPKCSVSECARTKRHYARERSAKKESNIKEHDAMYSFYESVYDSVHYYIFHLFEVGLRVDASSLSVSEDGDEKQDMESGRASVDKRFTAERDLIKSRSRECTLDFHRFKNANNKYTIQSARIREKQGITLTDALFQTLIKNEKVEKESLQSIRHYSVQNAFDSDALEHDLEKTADSNLYTVIQNQSTTNEMSKFIQSVNRMFISSFCNFHFIFERQSSVITHQSSLIEQQASNLNRP